MKSLLQFSLTATLAVVALASTLRADPPAVAMPTGPKPVTAAGTGTAVIDVSKLNLTPLGVGNATVNGATAANAGPKAPVDPSGVWKWTVMNRNGQPVENLLRLTADKTGKVDGTLLDRSGTHPITNPSVKNGVLTFTVVYHTLGVGDVPFTYSVNLDPDNPKVSTDRPDFTPAGRAAGKLRHREDAAKHTTGS